MNNLAGLQRNLTQSLADSRNASARLSSGKRINRPSDDPAGNALASQLNATTNLLSAAGRNTSVAQSLNATRDGTLASLSSIGTRLQELSIQAASGTLSSTQRASLDEEFQSLSNEFTRITESASFGDIPLFEGNPRSVQVGIDGSESSQVSLPSNELSTNINNTSLFSQDAARDAITSTEEFKSLLNEARLETGATTTTLVTIEETLESASVANAGALSQIEDASISQETSALLRAQLQAKLSARLQTSFGNIETSLQLSLIA